MTVSEHYKNAKVLTPLKCPGCGETDSRAFGKPYIWGIEDDSLPCKHVILKGWYCNEKLFGTVIRRGPVIEDGETEPVNIEETDCVYIKLPGRTFYCVGSSHD
jgi:hypothetical protein